MLGGGEYPVALAHVRSLASSSSRPPPVPPTSSPPKPGDHGHLTLTTKVLRDSDGSTDSGEGGLDGAPQEDINNRGSLGDIPFIDSSSSGSPCESEDEGIGPSWRRRAGPSDHRENSVSWCPQGQGAASSINSRCNGSEWCGCSSQDSGVGASAEVLIQGLSLCSSSSSARGGLSGVASATAGTTERTTQCVYHTGALPGTTRDGLTHHHTPTTQHNNPPGPPPEGGVIHQLPTGTAPNISTHAARPQASTMAAPDTAAAAPRPTSAPEGGGGGTTKSKGHSTAIPPKPIKLRSALKRAGQKSRGHKVFINLDKNKSLEADYVILVHDESEPQLVSIRSFDLSLGGHHQGQGVPGAPGGVPPPVGGGTGPPPQEQQPLTLSPPEGYKDCFSHALHEHLQDESDSDVSSIGEVLGHSSECPARANLPDLVNHRVSSGSSQSKNTKLTVENVRHHEQLMKGNENTVDNNEDDNKVVKTGILKGGKHWKNGDGKKNMNREVEEEDQRRSVRFSGKDEYSMLDNIPLDSIPLDAANSAALAKFMPKLRELGVLLGEDPQDWHVELSPMNPEVDNTGRQIEEETVKTEIKQLPPPMDDEAIGESMQRYDEMRRRIAAAEGRDNTSVCSDESKSSSDSQSSDSTMTETRIRRIENNDTAHMAGGIMRSNSEVRRAIERNALRRSLTRFTDTRKKENNKNDKSEKGETSLLEKLKWLTASEDATNGNSEHKDENEENNKEEEEMEKIRVDPKVQDTVNQYRKLAEMFNKTTSLRANDIVIPADVREWKMQEVIFPEQKTRPESRQECIGESSSGSTTPTVFQAVPAMSIGESVSGDDDESDKLIYSGGVRYTREGTLPQPNAEEQPDISPSVPSDVRKQFLSQMTGVIPHTNGIAAGHPRERSSMASNSDSYTLDDIDEALVDDHSSSVPSSSQSSPRLSGGSARSDMDGTSTTESGYSSQETNGEHVPFNTLLDVDELAEFVRKDASRMERLRRRYDSGETEDHGFNRRPSVRGIKARFGSTTDLLQQMANQLAPPPMAQPGYAGSHMTWPYREVGSEDDSGPPPRRRAAANRANILPSLQEDAPYIPASVDLSPQMISSINTAPTSLAHTRAPRVVHVYASTGDLRAPPPSRMAVLHESPPPDLIRPVGVPPPRALSHTSLNQMNGSQQSLIMAPMVSAAMYQDPHHQCRRPASVHGHLPQDSLVMRGAPPLIMSRPHSTLGQYPVSATTRMPEVYRAQEETLSQRVVYESGHQPLAQRGSYPGTFPSGPQYPTPPQYANPPPYNSSLPQYPSAPVDNTGSLPRHIQQYHQHSQLQQQQQQQQQHHQHQQLPQHQQLQQQQQLQQHQQLTQQQQLQQHQQLQQQLQQQQHQQQHSHLQQLSHTLPHQHQHIPIQHPPHQQQQPSNLSQQLPQHIHSHQPVPSARTSVSYVRSIPSTGVSSQGVSISQSGMVHQCGAPQPRVSSVSCVTGQSWTQQSISTSQIHPAYLPPPPMSNLSISSHMSYSTPIVPESGISRLPPPTSGGMPILNGSIGKLEGIRDERGVPEGASSSPRGALDPPPQQYGSGTQISPTRESSMLHRQMSMT